MGLDGAKELYRSGSLDFEMILFDGSKVYVSEGIASGFSTDMDKEIITRQEYLQKALLERQCLLW